MGKNNSESSAFLLVGSDCDMAFMDLYYLFTDRQAQAMATDLLGVITPVERLKNLVYLICGDTYAVIFYLNNDILGKEIDAYLGSIVTGEFAGIINEVKKKHL